MSATLVTSAGWITAFHPPAVNSAWLMPYSGSICGDTYWHGPATSLR